MLKCIAANADAALPICIEHTMVQLCVLHAGGESKGLALRRAKVQYRLERQRLCV